MKFKPVVYLGFAFAICGILTSPLADPWALISPIAAFGALGCVFFLIYRNREGAGRDFVSRTSPLVWTLGLAAIGLIFYNTITMGDHLAWHRAVSALPVHRW